MKHPQILYIDILKNVKIPRKVILNRGGIMKARQLFNELDAIEKQIKEKRELVKTYRQLSREVRITKLSHIPKNHHNRLHPMEDLITKSMDLEREIFELEILESTLQGHILELIQQLEGDLQIIIIQRHFNRQRWSEIAKIVNYSERWVYKLYNEAVKQISEILNDIEKNYIQ